MELAAGGPAGGHALFIGIMAKWYMDPEQALSARELAVGLRIVAERIAGQDGKDGNGA